MADIDLKIERTFNELDQRIKVICNISLALNNGLNNEPPFDDGPCKHHSPGTSKFHSLRTMMELLIPMTT